MIDKDRHSSIEREVIWSVAQLSFINKTDSCDPLDVVINMPNADFDEIEYLLMCICQKYEIDMDVFFKLLSKRFPCFEKKAGWKF